MRKKWLQPGVMAASLLYGAAQACGRAMNEADTLAVLTSRPLEAAGTALAFALLCYGVTLGLEALMERPARSARAWPFWAPFLILLACWLPWAIACYPGVINWDTFAALESAFGTPSDAHPMLLNWLMGGCVALGRALGSDNLGFFLFVLVQLTACAAVYAAVVVHVRSLWARCAVLAFYGLTPLFGVYTLIGNKDTLFGGALCLFVLLTVRRPEDRRGWALYALSALLLSLLRHGAMYIAFPLALWSLWQRRSGKRAAAGLAASLVLVLGFQYALLPALNVQPGNPAEPLCLPFQQAARVVRDEPSTVTERERAALAAVFDYDALAESYRPGNADPVKAMVYAKVYPARELKSRLMDFLSVWKGLLLKQPRACLEAWLGLSKGYWAFLPSGGHETYALAISHGAATDTGAFAFSQPDALAPARRALSGWANAFGDVPLLGRLQDCALYSLLLYALLCAALKKKRWRLLPAVAAPLLVAAACTLSPLDDCMRYFFAVIAAMPALLTCAAQESALHLQEPVV